MTCPRCETGNHPVAKCPEVLEERFGVPSDHEADTTSVSLREGETRDDDNTHARRNAAQLAMADDMEDDK